MADSKEVGQLAQAVVRGTAASQTTSATPAGLNEPSAREEPSAHREQPSAYGEPSAEERQSLVEAINQVFALFRLNYHNQFYAAFPDNDQLKQLKRLWLEALSDYPTDVILRGARHAIEHSEYLPTLNRMLECCQQGLTHQGIPTPRSAFIEACEKPSPKLEQQWSHPAVYFAGRDSDWFFLANNGEQRTWPVFQRHYERYLIKVSRGEQLEMPTQEELPKPKSAPMTPEQRQEALKALREQTGL